MSGNREGDRDGGDELSDAEMEKVVGGLKDTVEQIPDKGLIRGEASASIDGDVVIESRFKR